MVRAVVLAFLLAATACAEFEIKRERPQATKPREPLRMNARNAAFVLIEEGSVVASATEVAVRQCIEIETDDIERRRTCDVLVMRDGEIIDRVRAIDADVPAAFSCRRSCPGAPLECRSRVPTWAEQSERARGPVTALVSRTMFGHRVQLVSNVFANSTISVAPYHARVRRGLLELVDPHGTHLAEVVWPFEVTPKRAIAVHRGPGVLVVELHTGRSNGFVVFAFDEQGGIELDGIVPPR